MKIIMEVGQPKDMKLNMLGRLDSWGRSISSESAWKLWIAEEAEAVYIRWQDNLANNLSLVGAREMVCSLRAVAALPADSGSMSTHTW